MPGAGRGTLLRDWLYIDGRHNPILPRLLHPCHTIFAGTDGAGQPNNSFKTSAGSTTGLAVMYAKPFTHGGQAFGPSNRQKAWPMPLLLLRLKRLSVLK